MADYTLQPDEVVLLSQDRIGYGTKSRIGDTFDLVLTNKNLVLTKKLVKGIGFSSTTEVVTFPISAVKTFNGRAQATVTDRYEVEVQSTSGQESFRFAEKKAAVRWAEHIDLLATGRESEIGQGSRMGNALPGAEYVSGALKDTVDVFKGRFKAKQPPPVKVMETCNHCGARIEGFSGRSVTCGYCGSVQVLGAASQTAPPTAGDVPAPGPPLAPGVAQAVGPPPPPSAPPGWVSDPHRRYELRYWDGTGWTHHVSSAGVQTTDPP